MQQAPVTGMITMYSTAWCGYCRRLKSWLDREGIGYRARARRTGRRRPTL